MKESESNVKSSAQVELKRLFLGGLFHDVKDGQLEEKFARFGNVSKIDIKTKNDVDGKPLSTFAYITLSTTEKNLNGCLRAYNKTKWKGCELQIQVAKESFLDRLKREQEARKKDEEPSKKLSTESKSSFAEGHEQVRNMTGTKAVPGSTVENMKDWVVGKFGRVLPVMHLRQKDKKKVVTVDPSQYCHKVKRLADAQTAQGDYKEASVEELTWQLEERDADEREKRLRQGDFSAVSRSASEAKRGGEVSRMKTGAKRTAMGQSVVAFDSDNEDGNVSAGSADSDELFDRLQSKKSTSANSKRLVANADQSGRSSFALNSVEKRKSFLGGEESDIDLDDDVDINQPLPKWLESDSESDGAVNAAPQKKTPKSAKVDAAKKSKNTSTTKVDKSVGQAVSTPKAKPMEQSSGPKSTRATDSPRSQQLESAQKYVKDLGSEKKAEILRHTDANRNAERGEVINKTTFARNTGPISNNLINSEFSSGFESLDHERSSDDDSDMDAFDLIEKGQVDQLYGKSPSTGGKKVVAEGAKRKPGSLNQQVTGAKSLEKKAGKVKDMNSPPKKAGTASLEHIRGALSRETSQTVPHTTKTDSRSTSNVEIKTGKKVEAGSVEGGQKSTDKHAMSNQQRLASVKQRLREAETQKSMIRQALGSVDTGSQKANKKVVFDSDSEGETDVRTASEEVSKEESETDATQGRKKKDLPAKASKALFDSSSDAEDESSSSDVDDEERFSLRPQYQGKTGAKLLELESRYTNDPRFKLDNRFAEKAWESEKQPQDDTETVAPPEVDDFERSKAERKRTLEILNGVVGPNRMQNKKVGKKTFKDMSSLHYDPSRQDHQQFEVKETKAPGKSSKKKSNKKAEAEAVEGVNKGDGVSAETDLPEVSKEKYYSVESTLKATMQATNKDPDNQPFSLLAMFGDHQAEGKGRHSNDTEQAQPLSTSGQSPWQQFYHDSSEEEDEVEKAAGVTDGGLQGDQKSKEDSLLGKDPFKPRQEPFFFTLGDPRIREAVNEFHSREDPATVRQRWLEQRPVMVEAYRAKRKRSLRTQRATPKFAKKRKWSK